ncbi:MAG: NAD(P)/FAD-dependent oxidoreductase [Erythrobacter sp.]|uniref:FAD-dependent oxidoreductase n=1 Tax=Erythrobacter sp. TaxID=1042 RepID=UPI0032636916
MDRYSIAIAGCGPAGLAAAILLNRQGHDVAIYDQFDEPGPVGSGLMIQPSGLAVLDRLGLAEETLKSGARVDGLLGIEEHGKTVLDAPYSALGVPGAFGIGIHRASLFGLLYEAALARGIRIETRHAVTGSNLTKEGRALVFSAREATRPYDLIIDASGRQSVFDTAPPGDLEFGAVWASLPTFANDPFAGNLLEQRYRRAAQMVGVLPIGTRKGASHKEAAFFWSLKRSDVAGWQDTPLEQWKENVHALWPEAQVLLDRITSRDQLTFASYAHRTQNPPTRERMIAIGDAWHSASPQLGQGANMALLDAWGLAQGMVHGRTFSEKLRLAVSWRHDHIWLYQWVTKLFTPLYQSDTSWHPMIRDKFMAPLAQIWPISQIQAQLMSGLFGFPLATLGLSVPDYEALWEASESSASRT